MNESDAEILWNKKEYFSKGKRGLIYVSKHKNLKYVIKEKNPAASVDTVENEALFNKKLNKIGVGPKFFFFHIKKNFLVREKIEGDNIYDWLSNSFPNKKKKFKKIALSILAQCREMDSAGINKQELTHPDKDILIDKKGVPWIIDFERCRSTNKPHNVNQFCDFLTRKDVLNSVGAKISDEKVISLRTSLSDYKKTLNEKEYVKVKNLISSIFS